jgi:hypothetical protein
MGCKTIVLRTTRKLLCSTSPRISILPCLSDYLSLPFSLNGVESPEFPFFDGLFFLVSCSWSPILYPSLVSFFSFFELFP